MELKWFNYNDKNFKDSEYIRNEVFVKEIGFSYDFEFDDSDKDALHLVCYKDNTPVCNARILKKSDNSYHFGRLACLKEYRGYGYGKICVNAAISKAIELKADKLTLGAKYDKKPFYESLGFIPYGDIFHEEGIPHINMYKNLKENNMINQETRDLFDIPHHANLFALIYRRAVLLYGEEGRKAADEGTKHYGMQRGARMAQRALKDGAPLTMRNYRLYGEWTDKNKRSKSITKQTSPVMLTDSTVCGWCEAWKESGLLEYGCNYCTYVDKNLVKGFNPELKLEIHSVLSQGGDVCAFEWCGFEFKDEADAKKFAQDKENLGGKQIKDFLYHTAHLLVAMTEALQSNLNDEKRAKVRERAIEDFKNMYGEIMTDALLKESAQDFTKVDY